MLIAKAKDPAFWEKVRTSDAYRPMREELLAMWEKVGVDPIPASKYSVFTIYNVTGSRREYEEMYFYRRRSLNTAALLSLIYPEEEKYFIRLLDTMWAILDEYTWVLPAHMPSFTENVVEFIDLFAAETGYALSEMSYIFGDRLPPLIRSRIRAEIDRRIVAAYTGERRYWWEKGTNNWAAVCMGSVGATFLYMHPEMVEALLPRFEATLACFLRGFPEDGICLEGFGYWHYGFGFFTCFADMLREFTNGRINYFADPKVKQIAKFAQRAFLTESCTVSFSDSGASGRYHIGLLHYLKDEYPNEIQLPPRKYSYTNDGCGRWCLHLRAFLWFDESLADADPSATVTDYAPDAQWLIRKTPRYSFAAKGGTNAEPHNHNDLGTFIVAKDGAQYLWDLGSGTYNKAYFSSRRYDNFHACSRGHSVPIVGGKYQAPGAPHSADASYTDGVFRVEFHRGYDLPALTKLERAFSFTEDAVTLTDTFVLDGDEPIVERFVTRSVPEITPDGVKVGPLLVRAEGDTVASFEITHLGAKDEVSCLDFTLKPGARSFTLRVEA